MVPHFSVSLPLEFRRVGDGLGKGSIKIRQCFQCFCEETLMEIEWRPYRESNPGYLREREVS